MKRLSILICSLYEREFLLNRLLEVLKPQITSEIEYIIDVDNGEVTTGFKRNRLLEKATGEYISFIDDDDLISKDYVSKIFNATRTSPDCCGMEGLITFQKRKITRKFIHTIKCTEWYEKDHVYYRCPNHLSPVKRIHAITTKFPDITVGEDHDYSNRLRPLLKTEIYIDGPIYFYLTD